MTRRHTFFSHQATKPRSILALFPSLIGNRPSFLSGEFTAVVLLYPPIPLECGGDFTSALTELRGT